MAKQRDRVVLRMIEDEMKQSFLDYSMSVIVQRALPDVRDGLKPVHRRILYSMHETGLSPSRPFKKAATVVGDVLGKYHPHGDSAVYDALVRMVQDFSLRYPLVDGQGNFGSIDGDAAAAYRYTEAKLAPIATEMLADIDKETVDFSPNFDDRLLEPTVLPAKLPNLLVNGSSGIAVGMSTNVPPHNLREVCRAAIHLLDHPECTLDDLMQIIPGPDFPTGGLIVGTEGIRQAYETGRGRVVMQARVVKETKRAGREQLVVTEIPYATSKTRIIEQIVELTKKGKVTDVSDLRDESDRDGIRIVIELKRGADADKVLRQLLKWTALQSTFGVISLALHNGVPREFTLKEMLERFRDHRIEVVVRRSQWELGRARDEAHVLRGLIIALKNIDEVVRIIRTSRTRESAGEKLRKQFELSERQSDAILLMRLYRLTQLETKELKDRLAALELRIAELEAILASPALQLAEIRRELAEILERYGDARRTRIVQASAKMVVEDLLAQEDVVVTISRAGFIQQIPMYLYRRRMSSGKALAGMDRYEGDYLEHVFAASTVDTLMFFSDDGQAYWLAVQNIPEASATSRGKALHQILELPRQARIAAHLVLGKQLDDTLVFFTEQGMIKRTPLAEFASHRAGGVNAINLKSGDRLLEVQLSDGSADLVLVSRNGRVIRFPEAEVSEMGRVAQGVRGMKLGSADRVVGAGVVRREAALALVSEKGIAQRVLLAEFSPQRRDGLGVVAVAGGTKAGKLAAAREVLPGDALMVVPASGEPVRVSAEALPLTAPGDAGEPIPGFPRGASVVEVTRVASREEEEEGDAPPQAAEVPPVLELDAVALADEPDAAGGTEEDDGVQFDLLGAGD